MSIPNFGEMSEAGTGFNYANWTPGTLLRLVSVPWGSDYRDVVAFGSSEARRDYLTNGAGPTIELPDSVYGKPGEGVRVPVPFNVVSEYNYIQVHNPAQPVPGDDYSKSYYYFITGVEYIAPNTTLIAVQLDVWQTYIAQVEFGNAFIERGHIGIANQNAMMDSGQRYLVEPEGLDIGAEYTVKQRVRENMASSRVDGEAHGDYAVLITSTMELEGDLGTMDDPTMNTARGSSAQGLPNGAKFYVIEGSEKLNNLMAYLSFKPWAAQGITSITAVPSLGRYDLLSNMEETWIGEEDGSHPGHLGVTAYVFDATASYTPHTNQVAMMPDFRDQIRAELPTRYQHLDKFLTFPYSLFELTTYNGQPITIKPERWRGSDATVAETANIVPPGQRITVWPTFVNTPGTADPIFDGRGLVDDGGEFLDLATHISNFPQFTIVTNQGIAYLAQNSGGIAYQRESADWAQQRALQGAQTAFDQSSNSISSTQQQGRIARDIASQQTDQANTYAGQRALTSGITQVGGAAIGGAMMGGGVGAAIGGIGGAVNTAAGYGMETSNNNANLAIQNQATRRNTANDVQAQRFNRDTNKNYADFAAKGDYENQISGINAKVQDIKNMQPSVSGQVGGEAFNLAMHGMGYSLKLKMVDWGAIERMGEHWLRYGYAVNRFSAMPSIPSRLLVMDKFAYWKVKELTLIGTRIPEHFKQAFRGIMEKGVTVWANPEDIGRVDPGTNTVARQTTIGFW